MDGPAGRVAYRAVRDILVRHRDDYNAAVTAFRWPSGSTRGSRKLLRAKRSDGCISLPVSRVHFATGDMRCGPRSSDAQIPPLGI
jgi:hypothetical protein